MRNGKYQLKSPKGGECGTFEVSGERIVLTSEAGKKTLIKGNGSFFYTIGDGGYKFKLKPAEMKMLLQL